MAPQEKSSINGLIVRTKKAGMAWKPGQVKLDPSPSYRQSRNSSLRYYWELELLLIMVTRRHCGRAKSSPLWLKRPFRLNTFLLELPGSWNAWASLHKSLAGERGNRIKKSRRMAECPLPGDTPASRRARCNHLLSWWIYSKIRVSPWPNLGHKRSNPSCKNNRLQASVKPYFSSEFRR